MPAANVQQRNPRKRPGDATGREKERLEKENQERLDLAAEQMATTQQRKVQQRKEVVDYTTANRHIPVPVPVEPVDPNAPVPTYTVRIMADIEDMVFGRDIISPAEFNENGECTKVPILGGLRFYNFEEGVEYEVDEDLYLWLLKLGYVYDY